MSHESSFRLLARAIKRTPDRLLHAWRRRRARARVAALTPDALLFVCLGNICRSPFAAAAATRALGGWDPRRIDSAGFIGPDRPSPPEAIRAAGEFGIDLTPHRSKTLMLGSPLNGLVVVMDAAQIGRLRRAGIDARHVLVLGDLDPLPIDLRTIPDPFERPYDDFVACYRRVDRCVAELAALLTPPPRP